MLLQTVIIFRGAKLTHNIQQTCSSVHQHILSSVVCIFYTATHYGVLQPSPENTTIYRNNYECVLAYEDQKEKKQFWIWMFRGNIQRYLATTVGDPHFFTELHSVINLQNWKLKKIW